MGRLMCTRLYIAGPMTGVEELNYPLFHQVQAELVSAGYRVFNPANNNPIMSDPRWSDYMRMAVQQVALCDGVAVLPGWQDSAGASLEVRLANDLGIEHKGWERWAELAPGPAPVPTSERIAHMVARPLPSIDPHDTSWTRELRA